MEGDRTKRRSLGGGQRSLKGPGLFLFLTFLVYEVSHFTLPLRPNLIMLHQHKLFLLINTGSSRFERKPEFSGHQGGSLGRQNVLPRDRHLS